MNKKKIISVIMAVLMCASIIMFSGCGKKNETVHVRVTLTDAGNIAGAYKEVEAEDIDKDGVISISDAIASAHKTMYSGGADGYATEVTDYGTSIVRLLGVENGGSYGCYINNTYVSNYNDPIKDGDHIYAYSYKDLTAWSDVYSFFDRAEVKAGEDITLKLTYIGFDENYSPVELPAAGAVITVDGEKTELVTGDDGTVNIKAEQGAHIISAVSDEITLVPPVCIVTAG